jgi:hypothetical protein
LAFSQDHDKHCNDTTRRSTSTGSPTLPLNISALLIDSPEAAGNSKPNAAMTIAKGKSKSNDPRHLTRRLQISYTNTIKM